jgi:hypothetical protein
MNGTSQQNVYVFPDDTVCFNILSDDADANQVLTLTWDQAIPAASFTTAGSPHPTGTFCWTPTLNDVRSLPYMFTSTILDDNCPSRGLQVYSFLIYVTLDSGIVFSGITEVPEKSLLTILPNPASSQIELSSEKSIRSVRIYNNTGKCVLSQRFKNGIIDISELTTGIYSVCAITSDDKIITRLFSKY